MPQPRDDHSVIFQPGQIPKEKGPESKGPFEAAVEKPFAPTHTEPASAAPPLSLTRIPRPADAAEIPPEVERIDPKSWRTIVGLATFLCVLALAAFFYLIQTARKLNIDDQTPPKTAQASKPKTEPSLPPAVPLKPRLRLYTDLVPGTVTLDNEEPRRLTDTEFILENLAIGKHSVKVAGGSGSASFEFEAGAKNAPKIIGVPQATNALAVLVSSEDGHGELVTSAGPSEILIDDRSAGQTSAAGLELMGLGSADHNLKIIHERDKQTFVMTYTPEPVLTVYVKSDSNTGILQVVTGEDGVAVFIENELFRRKTDHGQVRISVRAGRYSIRVHKDGFTDPPAQFVDVKKAEVTQAKFVFAPTANIAGLQVRGAQPGTTVYIDQNFVGAIGTDGAAKISNIRPGEHDLELRHEQSVTKRWQRTFAPGELLTLSGADVMLEKSTADANKPGKSGTTVNIPSAEPVSGAPNQTEPDGTRVQKGGGFITYGTPRAAGHYSFRTQGHVGGILKKSKLQWYAGFQDNQNYVLFSLDGKHAEVREMRNGKNILWNRIPCNVDSSSWVQVDLAVRPGIVSSRVRTNGEGWLDLGSVASFGRDFTQDKVGFYIPPNDEVAVSNFNFAR